MPLKKRLEKFSQAQLEKLTENDKNVVYEYKERKPLPKAQIVPLQLVHDKVKRLRHLYLQERAMTQGTEFNYHENNLVKNKLRLTNEWKRFDYTHPLIFDLVTGLNTTDEDMQLLVDMIRLKFNPNKNKKHAHKLITKARKKSSTGSNH